jgi:deoxyribodipyrimidine photo-lyase
LNRAPVQLVWFKRDLRVVDHAPLAQAAARGPVLPLYVVEPGLWAQPDAAGRHWAFLRDSLDALRSALAQLGQALVVRTGPVEEVFAALARQRKIAAVWSHQETGNGWTYARDRALAAWLGARGIPWHELPQHGVVRGLRSRDGWSRRWEQQMTAPTHAAPPGLPALGALDPGPLPDTPAAALGPDPCPGRPAGGRAAGLSLLDSFLHSRGAAYHAEMSSPLTAEHACSRLSPHLAWGTVSLREVLQATRARRAAVRASPPVARGNWARALAAFEGRLHWHCHFIQKLESEPRIEFENVHRACDGLREDAFDRGRFEAWCAAQTGFPFVDACLRQLAHTGWINFRMRAMLMSFASYHLWLHWREPALFLARRFVDYEPGIHYPQAQMQSGTTGINTLRIYNPVKQSQDQDPEGVFIRRWVPELAGVPSDWLHTPWRMPSPLQRQAGVRIGSDYPAPIVDHAEAARLARQRLQSARRTDGARDESQRILRRHGSRKRPGTPRPAQPAGDLFAEEP